VLDRDSREATLAVYDLRTGSQQRIISRFGDGPGEFKYPPDDLVVMSSGRLAVNTGRSAATFTRAGDVVRLDLVGQTGWLSRAATINSRTPLYRLLGSTARNRLIVENLRTVRDSTLPLRAIRFGNLPVNSEILLLDPEAEKPTPIGSVRLDLTDLPTRRAALLSPTYVSPVGKVVVFRGSIFYSSGEVMGFAMLTADGKLALQARTTDPLRTFTPEELAEMNRFRAAHMDGIISDWVDSRLLGLPPAGPKRDTAIARYSREWQMESLPRLAPQVSDMIVDSDGYVWLQKYTPPYESVDKCAWLVFAPSGSLLGTVLIPADVRVFEIGSDYVLGRFQTPQRTHLVVMFELSRSD
jgi:hypothetical protein